MLIYTIFGSVFRVDRIHMLPPEIVSQEDLSTALRVRLVLLKPSHLYRGASVIDIPLRPAMIDEFKRI